MHNLLTKGLFNLNNTQQLRLTSKSLKKPIFIIVFIYFIILLAHHIHRFSPSSSSSNKGYKSNLKRWRTNDEYGNKVNISFVFGDKEDDLKRNKLQNSKYIMFRCDRKKDRHDCGGLGDRLKGVMAAFLWSILENRQFLLKINRPCNFTQLLEPNVVKWNQNVEILKSETAEIDKRC